MLGAFIAIVTVLLITTLAYVLIHSMKSNSLTVEIRTNEYTAERYELTNAKIGNNFISGNTVSKDGKISTDIMFPINKIECVIVNQVPYEEKKKTSFFNKSDK